MLLRLINCRFIIIIIITPLLKKPDLNTADAQSYRPITNLFVLSKLLERLVVQQLLKYLNEAKLLRKLQSAYRAHHSTETVVLKVLGDILRALDSGDYLDEMCTSGAAGLPVSREALTRQTNL